MNKEFVPYQEALELKQLGFDESCLAFYDGKNDSKIYFNNIRNGTGDYLPFTKHDRLSWFGAPTFSQAFRWFREKYEIEATTSCFYNKRLDIPYEKRQYHCHVIRDGVTSKGPRYKTYEEAELACLRKLIKLVK